MISSVPFYKHQLGSSEIAAFADAISHDILTTGSFVKEFELRFAEVLGARQCVALQSCTAALHLSIEAFQFPKGSEVITTPMTFVATALAILQAGLVPVFCDIDPLTGNLDIMKLRSCLSSKTVAVMPVHLYGQMMDMRSLMSFCNEYNLICIEDSAHCVEGVYMSTRPAELSSGACFSFYATKNLTCGEGGCFVTNDDELAERVRLLRSHGVDKTAYDRYNEGYSHWKLRANGWKYNLDNLHASILLPQLPLITTKLATREKAALYYESALSAIPEVTLIKPLSNTIHARHLFPIVVPPKMRDSLISYLQSRSIGTVVNYRSLNNYQTIMTASNTSLSSFEQASLHGDSCLSLPFYPGISSQQQEYVVLAISKFFEANR